MVRKFLLETSSLAIHRSDKRECCSQPIGIRDHFQTKTPRSRTPRLMAPTMGQAAWLCCLRSQGFLGRAIHPMLELTSSSLTVKIGEKEMALRKGFGRRKDLTHGGAWVRNIGQSTNTSQDTQLFMEF